MFIFTNFLLILFKKKLVLINFKMMDIRDVNDNFQGLKFYRICFILKINIFQKKI